VTGGGRGIGRAVARRLGRDGPVVVVGRTYRDLAAVCRDVAAGGGAAAPCRGDVADPDTARRAVEIAAACGWAVGNLVCNAGIGKGGATAKVKPADWRRVFDVNVHGAFYLIRACLPGMIERGRGSVVLMSSLAGVKGVKYDAAYTASKHALVGLARSLALEVGKHGICAVALCPGFVDTDMTAGTVRNQVEHHGLSEAAARQKLADLAPLRRIMPPEEVAEVVALVCGGQLASVSGNPLVLGGA
jgi:NAD(P)-dependent dehydrogenase (short-subunit alcohol dehydrogenase family)